MAVQEFQKKQFQGVR